MMKWQERIAWLLMIGLTAALLAIVPAGYVLNGEQSGFARPILTVRDQLRFNYVEDLSGTKAAKQLTERAISGMLSGLDDYTEYFPPADAERFKRIVTGNFQGIGVQLNINSQGEIEVTTPMDNSPALAAGLAPGDVILRASGVELRGMTFDQVRSHIAGEEGSTVALDVRKHTGEQVNLNVERRQITSPALFGLFRNPDGSQQFFIDPGSRIAYIRISQFTPDIAEHLRLELLKLLEQDMKGLILDLRENGGGELREAVDMCNLFIPEGVILRTKGTHRSEQTYTIEPGKTLPFFPMAMIVNQHSASASEIVAGALAEHRRATIVGTRTFGKGSVQEPIELGQGALLKMTVAHYYLPSGRLLHRKPDSTEWGVDPHITAEMTEEQQLQVRRGWEKGQVFYSKLQASTRPATTRPVDLQLQAAQEAVISDLLMRNQRPKP
jgi:carboxyl-terminal processing protease